MQNCCLKYENIGQPTRLLGVSDARMAVHVLEAQDHPARVELWQDDIRMCSIEPSKAGFWRVSW